MMNKIDSFSGRYRFLSNFWPCEVQLDGATYPSTEHAYQAAKTLDLHQRDAVRLAPTAGTAKKLGRQMNMRPDWEAVKISVMTDLVRQKFTGPLRSSLVATHPAELVEGNTWGDVFWGVCRGVGENHLGKVLMLVRSECIARLAAAAPSC